MRARLIQDGAIRPAADTDAPTPAPKLADDRRVLRLDDVGREAAKRAIARPTYATTFFAPDFFDTLRERARGERGR